MLNGVVQIIDHSKSPSSFLPATPISGRIFDNRVQHPLHILTCRVCPCGKLNKPEQHITENLFLSDRPCCDNSFDPGTSHWDDATSPVNWDTGICGHACGPVETVEEN
jgi:hypothetical protein